MAKKSSKLQILTNKGKTPKLGGLSTSKTSKSPLMPGASGQKRNFSKTTKLPEQAFAMPSFGDTGMTGES